MDIFSILLFQKNTWIFNICLTYIKHSLFLFFKTQFFVSTLNNTSENIIYSFPSIQGPVLLKMPTICANPSNISLMSSLLSKTQHTQHKIKLAMRILLKVAIYCIMQTLKMFCLLFLIGKVQCAYSKTLNECLEV